MAFFPLISDIYLQLKLLIDYLHETFNSDVTRDMFRYLHGEVFQKVFHQLSKYQFL